MNTLPDAPFSILTRAHQSQRAKLDRDYLVGRGHKANIATLAMRREFALAYDVMHAKVGTTALNDIVNKGPVEIVEDYIPALHSIVGVTINDPRWFADYVHNLQDAHSKQAQQRPCITAAFADYVLHHVSES